MLSNAFGLIYTGEANPHMRDLTTSRAVAALPFGSRYRVIDFILSNLVHSGVSSVGVIAQRNYHSLMDHLGSGKEWDLHRKREGLFILPPFMTKDTAGMYRGSVDAFHSVMGYVRRCPQEYCILSGTHIIFNTTFHDMVRQHEETGADITIMYRRENHFIPEEENNNLYITMDETSRVIDMELDPYKPTSVYKSCNCMVLSKRLLEYLVEEAYSRGECDFSRDVLLKKFRSLKVYGWKYNGYVAELNSVNDYYKHSMALFKPDIRADLFSRERPVYTKVKDEFSAHYCAGASVRNSLLADGCDIGGSVSNSILFRGVIVEKGAVVRDSILMQGVHVKAGSVLDHVILDKGVTIHEGRNLSGYDGFPIVIKKNAEV
ncbi:MAG: glucose-1-phosphate adenylyltransferase subunit GlgD [Clostridia bacterium]|nr:glucose-1-phosphate adenylyltransferase subunit GlgD [Clostridia bacterium]